MGVANDSAPIRKSIYCDDCGREKLAEIRNGKLIIMDRRHGKRHIAVLPAPDVFLSKLDKTHPP